MFCQDSKLLLLTFNVLIFWTENYYLHRYGGGVIISYIKAKPTWSTIVYRKGICKDLGQRYVKI